VSTLRQDSPAFFTDWDFVANQLVHRYMSSQLLSLDEDQVSPEAANDLLLDDLQWDHHDTEVLNVVTACGKTLLPMFHMRSHTNSLVSTKTLHF